MSSDPDHSGDEQPEAGQPTAGKIVGTVKWFNVKSGYGFINRDDTKEDVFVHRSAIKKNNPRKFLKSVGDGEVVEFDVMPGTKGLEAANVTGLGNTPVKGSEYAPNRWPRWFRPRGFGRRGGGPRGGGGPRRRSPTKNAEGASDGEEAVNGDDPPPRRRRRAPGARRGRGRGRGRGGDRRSDDQELSDGGAGRGSDNEHDDDAEQSARRRRPRGSGRGRGRGRGSRGGARSPTGDGEEQAAGGDQPPRQRRPRRRQPRKDNAGGGDEVGQGGEGEAQD